MPRDIDLSLVRAFVTVAEAGGMTAAARHLNLTQAAVSQQIKRLEEHFGAELFDRRQRRLRLTAHGERLLGHAERMLSLNDEAWSLMTTPEAEGAVRLGVPSDIVSPFLPPILKSFARSWPRIELTMVTGTTADLKARLERGEIDLTLTTEPATGPGSELLLADPLVWVGAPGGEAWRQTPLPVSCGDDSCAFRSVMVKVLREHGFQWRLICAIEDMAALGATIEADLAVAPFLSQTVPPVLAILGPESGLPPLPPFFINLYRAPKAACPFADELARHIGKSFAARYPMAA
jgi:DNA-binding transcriptional LysR family regulator